MTIARKSAPKNVFAFLTVLVLALLVAAPARADFGITPGSVALQLSSTEAGGHPDVTQAFAFNTKTVEGVTKQDGSPRTLQVQLPPGLIGDPTATKQCPQSELVLSLSGCSEDTQVGEAAVTLLFPSGFIFPFHARVFNMVPADDEVAALGFRVGPSFVHIAAKLRTGGDYGVTATVSDIPQTLTLIGSTVTLWGVPADHVEGTGQRRPFMTNPTSCGTPLTMTVSANSWQEPNLVSTETGTGPAITGCETPPFAPSVSIEPESPVAGAPSGYAVAVHLPQQGNPDGVETSTLKDTTVTLPAGVAVSPSSADGLGACSEQQIGLHSEAPPTCPSSSKIGSVRIETRLLPEPLEGAVYLAEQGDRPGQGSNPFGSMLAMYLTASGNGVQVKLAGKVEPDPVTGRLTTTFLDNPQLPFDNLTLRLKGGPRAALVNPGRCGSYLASADLTSWARPGEAVGLEPGFSIDQGCGKGSGFDPRFVAGGANPVAGAFSPFSLRVTRADGEQDVSRIAATLPEGELAKLAGVALCPEAAAAGGACPEASRVGTATVGVGAGSNPLYLPQAGKAPTAVYLSGPYKGGPYSLVTTVPAQAGPFDLGLVSVRSAIHVDPPTAQVSVESDPLPQILHGIPIDYRDVRVDVTRPQFTLNPTSCERQRVLGKITSEAGAVADVASRFQVGECAALKFAPKLSLSLAGGTKRGDNPALRAVLRQRPGQANIGRVSVALPHSEFLDQSHIGTVCTRPQFAQEACPAGSVYGHARAFTPLLDQPLEGPVYLRSSDNPLPDLVAALRGSIAIDLSGRIDSVHGGIRTTFSPVPDAPVTKFVLSMKGGKKGLLVNSTALCAKPHRAQVRMAGQNQKTSTAHPALAVTCGGKGKK